MNKFIPIAFVGIILVGGGLFLLSRSPAQLPQSPSPLVTDTSTSTLPPSDSTTDNNPESLAIYDEISPRFYHYHPQAVQAASQDGRAVIFFSAVWCPTCRANEADFQKNASQIPSDVTIFRADYDSEKELKQRYSVVIQDTFVQIDAQGNQLKKWNGGGQGVRILNANLI
jgi:thiol-disulfide isomerase/thioredoxin